MEPEPIDARIAAQDALERELEAAINSCAACELEGLCDTHEDRVGRAFASRVELAVACGVRITELPIRRALLEVRP